MEIRISGGRTLPLPATMPEITNQDFLPANSTEGQRSFGMGRGLFYKNVFGGNALLGYAVYANGEGFCPSGFVRYEPLKKPSKPPLAICEDCSTELGELDAELWFDGFNDAAHASVPRRCPVCQDWHEEIAYQIH